MNRQHTLSTLLLLSVAAMLWAAPRTPGQALDIARSTRLRKASASHILASRPARIAALYCFTMNSTTPPIIERK